MKNTRYLKIAAIALSCIILVAGIIGISVSANGADASAKFVNVTLNYGAETRIAYALSIDGANASDVTLELYDNAELSGDPVKATFPPLSNAVNIFTRASLPLEPTSCAL